MLLLKAEISSVEVPEHLFTDLQLEKPSSCLLHVGPAERR